MRQSAAKSTVIILLATSAMLALAWYATDRRVSASVDADTDPELHAFCQALRGGVTDAVEKALKAHPDWVGINIEDEGTPLHMAARYNRTAVIRVLLDHHADLKSRGIWNGTALQWAAWWGAKDAVVELLKRGADVEVRGDDFGGTPLLWAAHGSAHAPPGGGDYRGTIRELINAGAHAETANNAGVSAATLARPDITKLLIANGAKAPAPQTQPTEDQTVI